jgi:hypothetical protein
MTTRLYVPDVAVLLGVEPRTVTQYLWLAGSHVRTEGSRRPGDIPVPSGYEPRRGKGSGGGSPRPYWDTPGPVDGYVAGHQPPGKPRNDGQPRTWRSPVHARPGPRPRAPAPA